MKGTIAADEAARVREFVIDGTDHGKTDRARIMAAEVSLQISVEEFDAVPHVSRSTEQHHHHFLHPRPPLLLRHPTLPCCSIIHNGLA